MFLDFAEKFFLGKQLKVDSKMKDFATVFRVRQQIINIKNFFKLKIFIHEILFKTKLAKFQ